MPEKQSYLASVKEQLAAEISEITAEEDITLEQITNRLWRFMEAKLKESFTNGKKAAGAKNGSNPFRKEKG